VTAEQTTALVAAITALITATTGLIGAVVILWNRVEQTRAALNGHVSNGDHNP